MTMLEFSLLIVLFGFVWFGFWSGLIKTIGSIIGIFVGTYFAGLWYNQSANLAKPFVGGNETIAQIIGFSLVFVFTSQLFGVIFSLVNKTFKLASVIPGLKIINRLAGGILGFVEGTLVIGIILQFAGRLPLSESWSNQLTGSVIVKYFISLSGWLVPLFPKALEGIKSLFP